MANSFRLGRGSHASGTQLTLVGATVAVGLAGLLPHAGHYLPFMADDSLISARYAERLLAGDGLTWTDGERVEGYSNLLWTVGIAAVSLVGLDVLEAARLLGIGCIAVVFLALARAFPARTIAQSAPAALGALLLAASGPVSVWAIGGLEQPLVAALLACALASAFPLMDDGPSKRRAAWTGLPLALLCWSRPDGPLFTAGFVAALLIHHRFRVSAWVSGTIMALGPAVAVVSQLAFRLAYYGDWLPNPAYIKARLDTGRVLLGLEYFLGALPWMAPALALGGVGLLAAFRLRALRGRAVLLTACLLGWSLYMTLVGGDIFAARRHWVPLWVLIAFLAALGCQWILLWARGARRAIAVSSSFALLAALAWLQLRDPEVRRAKTQRFQWQGEVLARVLGEGFRAEGPLMAVTAAGTLPYFSRLPSLDMLGLNDRHIAHNRPAKAGHIGHDHGDGKYVLDRQPDLIVFHLGSPPRYGFGRVMRRDRRFKRDYQPVEFRGFAPSERSGTVYVRRQGKVGVKSDGATLDYPAFLLEGDDLTAQPAIDAGIAALLPEGHRFTTTELKLDSGLWHVATVPLACPVQLALLKSPGASLTPGQDGYVLSVRDQDAPVTLVVSTLAASTFLSSLRLQRLSEPVDDAVGHTKTASKGALSTETASRALGAFEAGFGEWRIAGKAFGKAPATAKGALRDLKGNVGSFLSSAASSRRDAAVGVARSPDFRPTAQAQLAFKIAGGKRKVGVRLMDGKKTVTAWHGRNSNHLRTVRFALGPLAGRTLHVEVYDEARGRWGHVLADEFALSFVDNR